MGTGVGDGASGTEMMGVDPTTSGGKLFFHLFAVLAEFKRDLIRERTSAGLTAARARGRNGGRPKGSMKKSGKRPWRSSAIRTTVSKRAVRLLGSHGIRIINTRAHEEDRRTNVRCNLSGRAG